MLPITASLCVKCKGRLWCQLPACPIIEKFEAKQKSVVKISGKRFEGSSPPSSFVSWKTYPKVSVGPLAVPVAGDSSLLENPQEWFGLPSSQIVQMRSGLIHSRVSLPASSASNPGKGLSVMQEMSMSLSPVGAEFLLKKEPRAILSFNDTVAPMGASAELEKISLTENAVVPKKVDSFFEDQSAKALDGVLELYASDFPVHYLSRILSTGVLGVKKNRKLTPTRWSITAVDSNVSKFLVDEHIKHFAQINEFELYSESYLGNNFFVLLCPGAWSFEVLEAWLSGAGWALYAEKNEVQVASDHEFYNGRKTYAGNVAGAYYAARLAVAEHLVKRKRQATAIVFREITPEYSVPLGVWVIRETVRKALSKRPLAFSEISLALKYVEARFSVRLENYLNASVVLDGLRKQKRLTEWTKA